jgi:hypothetical protein
MISKGITLGIAAAIAAAAVAIATGAAPSAAQDRVGVNSAVNPDANGTPPGLTARRLVIGQPVVFNERIATTAGGQTQILFLDESAMTIGPNSDLTIDQFVYDPSSGGGKVAMSATRGLLRYVGGKLSKQDGAVTVRTGTATLAVRGGAFIIDQDPGGRLDVYFIYGNGMSVTGTNGVTQTIRRPGFAISVATAGSSPSPPYPTPTVALTRLLAALDGRPGGNGGAAQPPSDATISSSGIGNIISGDVATSVQAAALSQPRPSPPQPIDVAGLQTNLQVNTVQSQGTPAIALLDGNPNIATNAMTAPTRTFFPVAALLAVDNGSTRVRSLGVASATLQNGVLSATTSSGAVSFPLAPGTNNFGPQGTSAVIGPVSGSVSGTSFLAPDNAFFYAVGTSPSFPNSVGGVIGGLPTVNLPTTGTGSYSGSATGTVFNNGANYVATGSFSNVYNFGTNTGNVTISNFDGRTFSGSVAGLGVTTAQAIQAAAAQGLALPANVGNLVYSGKLAGSGLTGVAGGAFFGDAAADTGGVFGVNSPSGAYKARGVFGGHR